MCQRSPSILVGYLLHELKEAHGQNVIRQVEAPLYGTVGEVDANDARVRTLAGLHLKGWFSGVFVSQAARNFYANLC